MSKLGLHFFSSSDGPLYRRTRIIFLVIYAVAVSAVLFPWPKVWGIYPMVLGLPFSMFWMVLAIVAIFLGLALLYRSEPEEE
jgi:hypothetical protein